MAVDFRSTRIFDPSRLKTGYRGILSRAQEDGAVCIRLRDEENLYIVRENIYSNLEVSHEQSQDFAQVVVASRQAMRDCDSGQPQAVALGRLSWAADLSPESFHAFMEQYTESFFRAVTDGDWERHGQLILEWKETALVERDPKLVARVLDRGDRSSEVDIARPDSEH